MVASSSQTPGGGVLAATSPPRQPIKPDDGLRSILAASIADASSVNLDPHVLLTNLLLTLVVILFMGVTSYIFNSTIDENKATIRRWQARILSPLWPLAAGISGVNGAFRSAVGRARLAPFARVAVVLVLSAVIYGFLDPSFGVNSASVLLFVGLLVGLGIATYLAEGGSTLLAVRRHRAASSVRIVGVGIVVAVTCVLASRLLDFRPGFMFGFIASSVILTPIALSKKAAAELVVIPTVLTLIAAILAWAALGLLRATTAVDPSPTPVLLETIAAILFIGGLEAVAFSLIPLTFMDGATVFNWNKAVWVVLFGTAVFLFWQLVINREAAYLEAFEQRSVLITVALLLVYGGVTLLVWSFFRYRNWQESRRAATG